MKRGDQVWTPFGEGRLLMYRETDAIYMIELPYATLYANKESVKEKDASSIKKQKTAMELNVAYESLEKMRKLNLELMCEERGIKNPDFDQCTICLMQKTPPLIDEKKPAAPRFPRLQRINSLVEERRKRPAATKPCLICGSPVCRSHSSQQFRKEKISVCLECERLFDMQFVVDCLTAGPKERRKLVDHMIDLYDRTCLLLKYSSQFIHQVAESLEQTTERQNKVGLGSSSAGIVSGVLGVAAAATIFTPAGPPLLIASLMFGGSATAVQTGTEVRNYYSEPNQLADRIIALNGMVLAILRVTGILRDALLRDHLRTDAFFERKDSFNDYYKKHHGSALAALTVGRSITMGRLATAAEVSTTAGRNASFFSKTGTGMLRTMRFARFAGGALSAATLVLEARCMTNTVYQIRAGNPCEKAETLRNIRDELEEFPSTTSLETECEHYLEAMTQRERRMTEEEAVRLLLDVAKIEEESEEGALILEADTTTLDSESLSNETSVSSASNMSASLLERIERYKEQEQIHANQTDNQETSPSSNMSASLIERINMYKQHESSDSNVATR